MKAETPLTQQARRLALSAEMTRRARRCLGDRVAEHADEEALIELARRLPGIASPVERAHGLCFRPDYPGVTAGVEDAGGGRRIVLACRALAKDASPLGVLFTTLITARAPTVAVAPGFTQIPPDWRSLDELT